MTDAGPLLPADDHLNHQIADTFATVSQTGRAWTEKIARLYHQIGQHLGCVEVDGMRTARHDSTWTSPRFHCWFRYYVSQPVTDIPLMQRASTVRSATLRWFTVPAVVKSSLSNTFGGESYFAKTKQSIECQQ